MILQAYLAAVVCKKREIIFGKVLDDKRQVSVFMIARGVNKVHPRANALPI